jgi:hypothetical protein
MPTVKNLSAMAMRSASFACVLNDTSDWYHWGCHGTSRGLHSLIARVLQPAVTATVPINVTYAPSYLPDSAETLRDPRSAVKFLKTWPAAHVLLEASEIIINGEGTIHGNSEGARRLLYIAFVCSRFLGKQVFLVNSSFFPPADAPETLDVYRLACASVHHLALRESHSVRLARELLERDVRLAFDCLPLGLSQAHLKPADGATPYVIITGTSGMTSAVAATLRAGASLLARNGWRLVWLLGAPQQPAADEEAQARSLAPVLNAQIVTAPTFEEWARLIRDARFLLSGRFHYIIARLCLGGHFAAFGGNTPKITAMLGDLALGHLKIGSPRDVTSTLAQVARVPMPPRLAALSDAASSNLINAVRQKEDGRKSPVGTSAPCVVRTIA